MHSTGLRVLFFAAVTLAFTAARGQRTYTGMLDGRLHTDPGSMGVAIFDAVPAGDARLREVSARPTDKAFAGMLSLPNGGALQFKAVIERSPDEADVLYIDADRDGHFGPGERLLFHPLTPAVDGLKDAVTFDVSLPPGPFRTCPMQVRLPKDGTPTPAGPTQLAVPYTSVAFVQGYAQLPTRKMLMRFQYDFVKQDVQLPSALEWIDTDGDGNIDQTPGSAEFVRAGNGAPVFRVERLTLQPASIDLQRNSFTLRSVPASAYQRIPLSVRSRMPNFEFTDFSGVRRHLSDVQGRYRLIDFWATWCVPCVKDLPAQKKTYDAFHGKGFEILGMNGDETIEKPEKLLKREGIGWQQARLDKHLYQDRFQITLWPTMILLDAHGKIVSMGQPQHLPLGGDNLAKSLQTLLGRAGR